jgi:hypothetical protein
MLSQPYVTGNGVGMSILRSAILGMKNQEVLMGLQDQALTYHTL